MRLFIVATIAVMFAGPAAAQGGPSFDCARASTAVEKTICRDAGLAAADRAMAEAYKQLFDKLAGQAREQLQQDQARWLAARNQVCTDGGTRIDICLKNRIENRTSNLRALAVGAYPFISQQTIIKVGKVKAASFHIDASYPQFDGKSADFTTANRYFADRARVGLADAVPNADEFAERPQSWGYDQSYLLFRPGPGAVAVATTYYRFTGGAHGYGATEGALVDLQSGKLLGPADLFAPDGRWLASLRDWVAADLKKQFVERPGFDDALAPENLDRMLRETERYIWRADSLVIVFNQYDVAAYVMGPYVVHLSYAQLAPLLRPDAPVGK